MKTAIIVQARMTSSRLPGKVLKTVLGKPLLEYQIERLRRVKGAPALVVAITTNVTDDIICEFCTRLDLPVYRGSEEDVLGRYYQAAVMTNADHVVSVTSDCPLIDPGVIDKVIALYNAGERFDYVSNTLERSYPRGLDVEVFSMKALGEMHHEAKRAHEREHVTPFIHDHPERYRLRQVHNERDFSSHRWTVDTVEDFELIRLILEALYPVKPDFGMQDVLDLCAKHPTWITLNQYVHQKELSGH